MKEQLISFETAKLAKDKNFSGNMGWNEYYYDEKHDNELIHGSDKSYPTDLNFNNMGEETLEQKEFSKWEKTLIKAPTQSLLQKWLREKHDIYISSYIDPFAGDFWYTIVLFKKGKDKATINEDSKTNFNDYEEALEKALYEALKLI